MRYECPTQMSEKFPLNMSKSDLLTVRRLQNCPQTSRTTQEGITAEDVLEEVGALVKRNLKYVENDFDFEILIAMKNTAVCVQVENLRNGKKQRAGLLFKETTHRRLALFGMLAGMTCLNRLQQASAVRFVLPNR